MRTKFFNILAGLALTAFTSGAAADMLLPLHAKALELGGYQGVVYFEQSAKGWEVVTTVGPRYGDSASMRYVSTLSEGQSQTLIIGGAEPFAVELARTKQGLAVYVVKPATVALH